MNKIGRSLIPVLLLMPGFVIAQGDATARMSAEAAMAKQRVTVAANMQLTKEQDKPFWPVYDEYAKSRNEIYHRLLNLVNTYATQYTALSDAQARDLLQEYLGIEAELLALHREYLDRFEKVLPSTKVLRFYQIDFRGMTETLSDIASVVPLAK